MITNDLKKDNIEITINTDNTIVLHYCFQNLSLNVGTKSKDSIFLSKEGISKDFLNSSLINLSCIPRIAKTAHWQNIDTNVLDMYVRKLWNNRQLHRQKRPSTKITSTSLL